MPLYYFDVHDGSETRDEDGIEFTDVATARVEAARFAASLLRDDPERFCGGGRWAVSLRNERGDRVFEVAIHGNDLPVAA